MLKLASKTISFFFSSSLSAQIVLSIDIYAKQRESEKKKIQFSSRGKFVQKAKEERDVFFWQTKKHFNHEHIEE